MGLARILSRQNELKKFQLALDEIDLDILQQFPSVRDFLKSHIKSQATEGEPRRIITQLIGEGQNPKITVYLFMRVVLEDFLLDGENHIFKGKLNRRGESFLAVYNNTIRELLRLGWFSDTQAREHLQEIREDVEAALPARTAPRATFG